MIVIINFNIIDARWSVCVKMEQRRISDMKDMNIHDQALEEGIPPAGHERIPLQMVGRTSRCRQDDENEGRQRFNDERIDK